MDKILIFGYGTLINEISLRKTVSNVGFIFPARLRGFVRVFNILEVEKLTRQYGGRISVLNIEKSEFNEYINGVCFEIDINEIEVLQKREKKYELVSVEVEDWNNSNSRYRAYVWRARHFESFDFQFNSIAQFEYLNICIEGCKQFGEDFLVEFMKTTFIGDKALIDFKELEAELSI